MAPIRTPEGFTRVEKAPGVAAKLLDAADLTKDANGQDDVRSVTGAYFVRDDVFKTYQETFGEDEVEQTPLGDGSVTEAAAAGEREGTEGGAPTNPDGTEATGDEGSGDEGNGDADEAPTADWTHDQLNEYAGKLTPPLELTGSTPTKAEKVQLIADHIEQNKA